MATDCQQYFGLRTSEGTFRYTAMPFGFSWSPFVAHVTVNEICKLVIEAGQTVSHYLIAWLKTAGSNWRKHYEYAKIDQYVETILRIFEVLPHAGSKSTPPRRRPSIQTHSEHGLGMSSSTFDAGYGIQRTQIYKAEAMAASWTVQDPALLPDHMVLRVDNQALYHVLRKGRSNIKEASHACATFFKDRLAGKVIIIHWIRSENNPGTVLMARL